MNDVHALTHDYEHWLADRIPVVKSELQRKHDEMRRREFRFLRGSYYVWLVRVRELLPDLMSGTPVPLVGDLHVENFGTWRDADGVRRWGVNDLDELARGPWALDLLRLGTSAVLVPHLELSVDDVCDIVLHEWRRTTQTVAVDLADDRAKHLRALVPEFASAHHFYATLAAGPVAHGVPEAVVAAARGIAEAGWAPTWHVHEAGTGSLGHRRVVGVGPADDGHTHAREAKQRDPGTCVWAATRGVDAIAPEPALYEAVRRSVRGPAAAARIPGWQLRDLAPDVVRIELSGLAAKDSERLLRSMARATADVHATDPGALDAARREAEDLDLAAAVATMVAATRADFRAYRG
jgi:uncharacterized protein (DUF2252 family)